MIETIVASLITGGLSLVGVVVTCIATSHKNENALKIAQAVTDTKIEELTREVREHNNFARRMPVVENELEHLVDDVHKLQSYHTSN